jgi:hypothetical protein
MQTQRCKNVGVLKFRVKKGNGPSSDTVGTLNMTLADRLELALILAQPSSGSDPLGIIASASTVAARLPSATHLTPQGRLKLFQGQYSLAWGTHPVKADAFITGLAKVSPDLRQMTVSLLAFTRNDNVLRVVTQFDAAVDPRLLTESGESFLVRGAFDAGQEEKAKDQAVTKAKQVKDAETTYPLQDRESPVALEITYDGYRVPLQIRDGKARIPEPRAGQKVALILRRTSKSAERFGVVLKVNGENTLFKERLADLQCRKWILDANAAPVTIRGFQVDDYSAKEFRVVSKPESKQNEVSYGPEVGTISLVVFREQKERARPPSLSDEAEDESALLRGIRPKKNPKSLAALQQQMRESGTRGLLGEGARVGASLTLVPFQPDPVPVLSAIITYYRP